MAAGADLVVGHLLGLVRCGAVGFVGSGQRFHDTDAKSVVRLAGTGHGNRGHGEPCGLKGWEARRAVFRCRKSHVRLKARRRRKGNRWQIVGRSWSDAMVWVSLIVGTKLGIDNVRFPTLGWPAKVLQPSHAKR